MLRPGGQLALVCHERDQRIPWARKLDRTLGTEVASDEPTADLVTSGLFGFVSEQSWKWWEIVNTVSLEKMLRTELADSAHSQDDKERRLADAMALYADYGRGADGMQMPWVSRCFKATVVESAWADPARPRRGAVHRPRHRGQGRGRGPRAHRPDQRGRRPGRPGRLGLRPPPHRLPLTRCGRCGDVPTSAPRPTGPRSAPCTPPRSPRPRCARG